MWCRRPAVPMAMQDIWQAGAGTSTSAGSHHGQPEPDSHAPDDPSPLSTRQHAASHPSRAHAKGLFYVLLVAQTFAAAGRLLELCPHVGTGTIGTE